MRVIGTAGHVDHGKSAVIKQLCGVDPDRLAIEKLRGMTIELGFTSMTLPSGEVCGFIDVPGHARFVNTMVAGASAIGGALICVAADDGVMPQTIEHLDVLRYLEIKPCVVVVTKCDLTPSDRQQTVVAQVLTELEHGGFNLIDTVFTSTKTLEGFQHLVRSIELLANIAQPKPSDSRSRVWIDRSMTIDGAGKVIAGTLTGSALSLGDHLQSLPGNEIARIREIQTHGASSATANAFSRVALNISGKQLDSFIRGHAAALPESFADISRIGVRLHASSQISKPLTQKGAFFFHSGTARVGVKLRLRNQSIKNGDADLAILTLDSPLPLRLGDRFVIRDAGADATVGGGEVVDIHLPKSDVSFDAIARLEADSDKIEHLVNRCGTIATDHLQKLVGPIPDHFKRLGRFVVSQSWMDTIQINAIALLAEFHATNPVAEGIELQRLSDELDPASPEVVANALRDIALRGSLEITEGLVALPNRETAFDSDTQLRVTNALTTLRSDGASPRDPNEAGLDRTLLDALVRRNLVVRVAPNIVYPIDVFNELCAVVVTVCTQKNGATVSQLREALNTTRKYAVPFLEELDKQKITQRRDNVRLPSPNATLSSE